MKKIVKLLAVLLISLCLFGCSGGETSLNYLINKKDDISIYEIEGKQYVETEEKTNLVKLDIGNYGIVIAELYPEIAIVTSEYHQYRAGQVAKSLDLDYGAISGYTVFWLFPTYYVRELYAILYEWFF